MKKVINYLNLRKVDISKQMDKLPPDIIDIDQQCIDTYAELEEEIIQIDQALLCLYVKDSKIDVKSDYTSTKHRTDDELLESWVQWLKRRINTHGEQGIRQALLGYHEDKIKQ